MNCASLNTNKDQKLQRRTFYGYKRQNEYNYVKSRQLPIIKYQISPIGIGTISSLRSKLQKIIGPLFQSERSKQIDPCFQFILKKLIYFQSINSQKKTDYKNIVFGQMIVDLTNPIHEQAIKNKVYQIIEKWQQQQNKLIYVFKKEQSRIQRQQIYYKKAVQFKEKLRQDLKLKFANKMNEYKDLTKQQRFFFSDVYIQQIIKNVDAIQMLRISQQSIKYNSFLTKNKEYFEVQLVRQRANTKPYHYIKINRPSNEIQPLLQNIYDIVRQREKNIDYKAESSILYKDIFEQIKRYEQSFEGNKYQCLNPANVIFDQISLAPKLSYQPLLLNTLGIAKKPMSVQARISFAPTPKQFDYFKSSHQFEQQTQIMLNDPFYGNIDIYDGDRHRIGKQQVEAVQEERKHLVEVKQKIMTQRFMLLSYYLLESNEFGFVPNLASNKQKEEELQQKIKQAHEIVMTDMSKLSIFFGLQNKSLKSKQFNYTLMQIGEYLSIQNQDSVVQSTKYVIVKKYFQCRNLIIKQFIRLLVNETIFGRIFNIKKYIFLFLTIAIQILQQSRRYLKAQRSQVKQRRKLRLYLQKELKRMKNDKNHYGYLQITYQKIDMYRKRGPKDHQAKFAKQEEIGKIIMKYIDQAKSNIKQIQQLNQILNKLEGKQSFGVEERKVFTETMDKIENKTNTYSQELKAILSQFIFSELRLKHRDGPHRFSSDSPKYFRDSCVIYTNRLQLLTLTFLNVSQANFIKYDSLVMPQFKIDEAQKTIQIYKDVSVIENQQNLLKIISEVIEPAKLLPKKMDKLSGKGINQDFRQYQQKNKQSLEYQIKQIEMQNIIYAEQGEIQNNF